MRRYAAMGRENDDELVERAEAGGRMGATPESASDAIELWQDETTAPMVHLGLEYSPLPPVGWGKWAALAVLAGLVLYSGKRAVGG